MWMLPPTSLFNAIRKVETGGEDDPYNAVGDGGLSIGPYQISEAYWKDAVAHVPDIGGVYEDVRVSEYAELIMLAYWDRYSPDDDYETLARIHNGGPRGHRKASTDMYWEKVQFELGLAVLEEASERPRRRK